MKLANPSIVIGLGGTGQWVLTYLKKNLIDTYGKVPPTVKLLAFDTTSPMMGYEEKAGSGLENFPQVGSVQLDNEEFVYLGGNIRRICEEIRDEGKHDHIGSWLQAKQYLSAFDDDAYEISKGAGQRRPFGRMAVFYDLATGSPEITGKLAQAINDVMIANQREQPIEFYIITSVAGGTGSGMFIDMAHIARKMAEEADVAFAIRGFIVLPNTFDPVIKVSNIEPNAFAAMRELDRFMLAFDRDYPIYYSESRREPLSVYHSIYRSKLFDSCYFIDAHRPNFPLTEVPPTKGVFPAIAESITVLLDPAVGDTFFQHFKNISNEVSRAQTETGKAIYSSLGTYTYILPVEDIIERNTYKAAIQLLRDYLLNIDRDSRDSLLRVSSKGNTETDLKPFEEVLRFLKMRRTHTGLQNLVFSQQVSRFLKLGRMKEQDLIDEMIHIGREILNWILPPVQNRVVQEASDQIMKNLETSLIDKVPNSRKYGDNPQEAAERIKNQILQIRECVLGREDARGNRTPGELQEGLLQYKEQNIIRFRTLLIENIENILNGIVDDPLRGKVGKLPYARDFTDRLIQSFDEFIAGMQKVGRLHFDKISWAREDVLATKRMMDDTRHLTGLLARLKGTAVDAENQYIAAENYLLELERQEMLYQSVLSTAEALRSVASDAIVQCDRWLDVLALGDPVRGKEHDKELGVYTKLLNQYKELEQRREEKAQVQVYKYLSGPGSTAGDGYKYEDGLYHRLIDEKWPNIMQRFSWKFEEIGGELYLRFKYGNEELVVERDRRNPATDINTRLLLEELRPYFYDVRNESIADRMEYLFTVQQAAKNLLDNAEPMINYVAREQKTSEKRNFVCISQDAQSRYFSDLAATLQKSAPNDRGNQVISLTNEHRCIVLSTVDILIGQDTAPYRSAKRVYKEYRGDRRLLHVFPAEVHASYFEQRLPQPPLYGAERLLDPTVVGLLEDQEMVRRFVLSLFYGLINVEKVPDGSGKSHYVLKLDTQNCSSFVRLTRPSVRPQIIEAMETFVYPQRSQRFNKWVIKDANPRSMNQVAVRALDEALKTREDSADKRHLVQRIEHYIDERPGEIEQLQGLVERLKNSRVNAERDLGAIMHLVLWDEIVRLEESTESYSFIGSYSIAKPLERPETKHPLHLMAERFLHQAGLDITLFRQRIIRCRINLPKLKYLLPDTVYAHIRPDEKLDSESVLSIYRKTQQIDLEASVVFVITNQGLADQGWAQIGTLRMKQFAVLPIDQSLMGKGLAERQESSVLRNEVEKRLGTDYDPYDERDPVADTFSFFGRDGLIETILRHNNAGRHVGIFGLRKLGKSSLLRVLRDRASFPVALVNLQTFNPNSNPLKQLYLRILRYWSQWSLVRYELDLEVPSLGDEDATGAFVSATVDLLDRIDLVAEEAHLGLFLDEVELIVPNLNGGGPDIQQYLTFMRAMRGLVDEDGRLSLVVASLNPSITRINRWNGEQNPTFNLLQEVYLPPLTEKDCIQMVRNIGRQIGLVYDDESVETITSLSGGHPFLARQFCSLLYRQRDRQPGQIELDAIPSAIEHFIYDAQTVTHLDAGIWQDAGNISLWGKAQARVNQEILLDLSRADEPLSEEAILDAPDVDTRRTALINLERFHFIHQPEPGYYALRYGLLRIWLRRRKLGLEGN